VDVTLARTFLAVVETGSFVEAARKVNVTQSTVSARIQSLEHQVGKVLFQRSKAGASLTPAGAQFRRHAQTLVRVWEQARLEVSLPEGYDTALTVGGQYSLWDGFLIGWLGWMHHKAPHVALRTEMGYSDMLMQRLIEGTVDIGVMYTPQSRPGFEIELLFAEELVMVSSEARPRGRPGKNYIYIDWGPEFAADHALNFPDVRMPGIFMELGSLGLNYMLENPATGYLPLRLIRPHLDAGRLKRLKKAPVFSYPAYAIYPADRDPALMRTAVQGLREIAREVSRR